MSSEDEVGECWCGRDLSDADGTCEACGLGECDCEKL
jgi:hypothetical protein